MPVASSGLPGSDTYRLLRLIDRAKARARSFNEFRRLIEEGGAVAYHWSITTRGQWACRTDCRAVKPA